MHMLDIVSRSLPMGWRATQRFVAAALLMLPVSLFTHDFLGIFTAA